MGLEPDVWEINAAEIARLPGYWPVEWSYAGPPDVAAVWRSPSTAGRSLVFNGHVDVVPATPEHHWTLDPWSAEVSRREDVRAWCGGHEGRGGGDDLRHAGAHGGRACDCAAPRVLRTVIEEECTGNGALAALARGYTGDAAIIPEPFGRQLSSRRSASCGRAIMVRGKGAHAERA